MFKDGRAIAVLGALALLPACVLGAAAPSALAAVPAVSVTGVLVNGGALSGEAGVIVTGAGSQIAWAALTVDGVQRASGDDGALFLDTGTLADGTHSVSITAGDEAGDSGQVWSGFIQTANAPAGGSATIAGDPREGQTVLAQSTGWSPQPTAVTYLWQRCDLAGDPCSAIAGATAVAYTVAAADDYGHLEVAVTATDTGGSTTVTSTSSALVADLQGNTSAAAIAAPLGSVLGQVVSSGGSGSSGSPGAAAAPSATGPDATATACATPRLRVRVAGRASVAVAFGRRVELRGSLHCGAAALKGAVLTVQIAPSGGSGHPRRVIVRTGAGGVFRYAVAVGPSRRIRVSYAGAGGKAAASVGASIVVTPAITLAITPTHTTNGHTITFAGTVSGGHEPAGGLPLELEYRQGSSWMNYTIVRTDPRSGRYFYRYTFRRTTQAITYTFRFVTPAAGVPGYPFAPGVSPARSVRVTP